MVNHHQGKNLNCSRRLPLNMSNFRSQILSLAKATFRVVGLDASFARNSFSEENILWQVLQKVT